jgi:hypothetical protein
MVITDLRQRQRFHSISKPIFGYRLHGQFLLTLISIFQLDLPKFLKQPPIFPLNFRILFLHKPMFPTTLLMRIVMIVLLVQRKVMLRFG